MDEDDQYVPQISQMDAGGFAYSDYSTDNFIPPSPGQQQVGGQQGPTEHQQQLWSQAQAQQHGPHGMQQHPMAGQPSQAMGHMGYYQQSPGMHPMQQQQMRGAPPTQQQMMPPPAMPHTPTTGKKGKKKTTKAAAAAAAQAAASKLMPPQQAMQMHEGVTPHGYTGGYHGAAGSVYPGAHAGPGYPTAQSHRPESGYPDQSAADPYTSQSAYGPGGASYGGQPGVYPGYPGSVGVRPMGQGYPGSSGFRQMPTQGYQRPQGSYMTPASHPSSGYPQQHSGYYAQQQPQYPGQASGPRYPGVMGGQSVQGQYPGVNYPGQQALRMSGYPGMSQQQGMQPQQGYPSGGPGYPGQQRMYPGQSSYEPLPPHPPPQQQQVSSAGTWTPHGRMESAGETMVNSSNHYQEMRSLQDQLQQFTQHGQTDNAQVQLQIQNLQQRIGYLRSQISSAASQVSNPANDQVPSAAMSGVQPDSGQPMPGQSQHVSQASSQQSNQGYPHSTYGNRVPPPDHMGLQNVAQVSPVSQPQHNYPPIPQEMTAKHHPLPQFNPGQGPISSLESMSGSFGVPQTTTVSVTTTQPTPAVQVSSTTGPQQPLLESSRGRSAEGAGDQKTETPPPPPPIPPTAMQSQPHYNAQQGNHHPVESIADTASSANQPYQAQPNVGAPPTSLAVVVPEGHKGPALQLNIGQPSSSSMSISLYQYGPSQGSSSPVVNRGSPSQSAAAQQMQSIHQPRTGPGGEQTQNYQNQIIPPEPVPPSLGPSRTSQSPVASQPQRQLQQHYMQPSAMQPMHRQPYPGGFAPGFDQRKKSLPVYAREAGNHPEKIMAPRFQGVAGDSYEFQDEIPLVDPTFALQEKSPKGKRKGRKPKNATEDGEPKPKKERKSPKKDPRKAKNVPEFEFAATSEVGGAIEQLGKITETISELTHAVGSSEESTNVKPNLQATTTTITDASLLPTIEPILTNTDIPETGATSSETQLISNDDLPLSKFQEPSITADLGTETDSLKPVVASGPDQSEVAEINTELLDNAETESKVKPVSDELDEDSPPEVHDSDAEEWKPKSKRKGGKKSIKKVKASKTPKQSAKDSKPAKKTAKGPNTPKTPRGRKGKGKNVVVEEMIEGTVLETALVDEPSEILSTEDETVETEESFIDSAEQNILDSALETEGKEKMDSPLETENKEKIPEEISETDNVTVSAPEAEPTIPEESNTDPQNSKITESTEKEKVEKDGQDSPDVTETPPETSGEEIPSTPIANAPSVKVSKGKTGRKKKADSKAKQPKSSTKGAKARSPKSGTTDDDFIDRELSKALNNESPEEEEIVKKTPKPKPKTPRQSAKKLKFYKKPKKKAVSDEDDSEDETVRGPKKTRQTLRMEFDEIPEDLMEKRRSSRVTKPKKYSEEQWDSALGIAPLPDDNSSPQTEQGLQQEDFAVVDKILLVRKRKKQDSSKVANAESAEQTEQTDTPATADASATETPKETEGLKPVEASTNGDPTKDEEPQQATEKSSADKPVDPPKEKESEEKKDEEKKKKENGSDSEDDSEEEFFVKYKNYSYLHCEWKTEKELREGDKRIRQKVKRFELRRDNATTFLDEQFDEDEPFNPDFIQVERVLDVSTVQEYLPVTPVPEVDDTDPAIEETPAHQNSETEETENKVEESEAKVASPSNRDDPVTMDTDEKTETTERETAEGKSCEEKTESGEAVVPSVEDATKEEQAEEVKTEPMLTEETQDTEEKEKEKEVESDEAMTVSKVEIEEEKEAVVSKKKKETVTHYLVKWRSLQYEECTWELEKDVDSDKISLFHSRKRPLPAKLKDKPRPDASEWEKVEGSPLFKGDNQLRDYQVEGLNWLLFCYYHRQNCILADEMGLGKTIQTISFLVHVRKYGIPGPFLIIAPLSTIHNWQREFETWSDINAVLYHGTTASRKMIQEYEFYYRNSKGKVIPKMYKFDALITTYEMVLVDVEELKEIQWKTLVIDEAHRLKNRKCKLLEGLSFFKFDHRVLLTGTPLQNNIDELFSLLNFLHPIQFDSSERFLEEFGTCESDEQVCKLQAILKPMMLRRLKEDVEKSLKPKEETIIEVELTNVQKKYYRAILERNFSYLSKGANGPSLMNTMMELRKCCNHPFLINGAEEQILTDYRQFHPDVTDEELMVHNSLVQSSGKAVLIDKLLPRLRQNGHKVLVFSQMVKCLDLLEEYLVHMKYPFERIDGSIRGDQRQVAIDRFSKPDSDRFVFLLCTRAGGLGINLTAADTVIIYDSDWNPQNDLQAQARCHRIGQEKFVKVYRLITRNTYEREMFDKASLKLGLDKAVLQSMGSKENMAAQLSKKEVEELLRKGAYAAVMDDASEGDKFCEEDIDQILQRRTQTITIQAGVKGSTFAKASFNVSTNREDIDVNDPNFWAKWAKKANVDPTLDPMEQLILYEPRTRKRRFNDENYQNVSEDSNDSDSDGDSQGGKKGGGRRRKRAGDDTDYAPDELAFTKGDYFKVEKAMGSFGWGRWKEIKEACELKQSITADDIEHMCRTVLLHCIREFSGDEKIREFIWELISPRGLMGEVEPSNADHNKHMRSHEGLHCNPVVRTGRKSARIENQKEEVKDEALEMFHQGWAALPAYNPPVMVVDYAYQRHFQRQANKVLLRVRLLYYVAHAVVAEFGEKILAGVPADQIDMDVPWHPELPAEWWDADADKSLLIGTYKHGYENFAAMREDPALCFLDRCGVAESSGTPDDSASTTEQEEGAEEDEYVAKKRKEKEAEILKAKQRKEEAANKRYLPFPSVADVNARFRRLISLFQRSTKMEIVREEQRAKRSQQRSAKQEHIQALLQEREIRRMEERQKWTRREELDFYRTVISFGVEQDPDTAEYRWDRFKELARLEPKFDQTLTDYYTALLAMCKRVCKRPLSKVEESLSLIPESLSEDRANKVLQRVDFMSRVRAILRHPKCNDRIMLCKRTPDLPSWWEPGKHDKDLLIGISKHGINKSEDTVVHDRSLSFFAIWRKLQQEQSVLIASRPGTRSIARLSNQIVSTDTSKLALNTSEKQEGAGVKSNEVKKEEVSADTKESDTSKEATKEGEKEGTTDKNEETTDKKEEIADKTKTDQDQDGKEKAEEEKSETQEPAEDLKPSMEVAEAHNFGDVDLTVAQILAQTSGNFLHWPKERMIIFRLQNICYTVEHGEWPTAVMPSSRSTGASGAGTPSVMTSDAEGRSMSPDTPRGTPFDDNRDSPFYSLPHTSNIKDIAYSGRVGRSGKSSVATPASGRRSRKGKVGGSAATPSSSNSQNPLQDLMESEKERMRALMHQSFLQQLEQFPFAAAMAASGGLPFLGITSTGGISLGSPSGATTVMSPIASTTTTSSAKGDEALNLSTKAGAKKSESNEKKTNKLAESEEMTGLPIHDMMAMATLPPDTRIPVLSLKDGRRLAGKEAPTLKTLAQWLNSHPHFIIDIPAPGVAALAHSSAPLDSELEPGEIPKPSSSSRSRDTSRESSKTGAGDSSSETRISVVNRKNGLKISDSKGPVLRNLIMWLEKNPDWDVDPTSTPLVRNSKLKIPEKLKARIRTDQPSVPTHKSHSSSTNLASPADNVKSTRSSVVASSTPSSATAPTPPAANPVTSTFDPFAGLFPGTSMAGLDPTALMQMQLMMSGMSSPFGNPALLGLMPGGSSFPGLIPGFPSSFPGMTCAPMTSLSATTTTTSSGSSSGRQQTDISTSKSSSSSSKKESGTSVPVELGNNVTVAKKRDRGESGRSGGTEKSAKSSSSHSSHSSSHHKERKEDSSSATRKSTDPSKSSSSSKSHHSSSAATSASAAVTAAAAAGLTPEQLSMLDPTSAAMAAANNPFLLAAGLGGADSQQAAAAAGIFGLNPFLSSAGLIPSLPPNMAAMAQLQSLMGMQGLESLMLGAGVSGASAGLGGSLFGIPGLGDLSVSATGGLPTSLTDAHFTSPSIGSSMDSGKRKHTTHASDSHSSHPASSSTPSLKSSRKPSSTTTAPGSSSGGKRKLDAMVSKLTAHLSESPNPTAESGTDKKKSE